MKFSYLSVRLDIPNSAAHIAACVLYCIILLSYSIYFISTVKRLIWSQYIFCRWPSYPTLSLPSCQTRLVPTSSTLKIWRNLSNAKGKKIPGVYISVFTVYRNAFAKFCLIDAALDLSQFTRCTHGNLIWFSISSSNLLFPLNWLVLLSRWCWQGPSCTV